MTGDKPVDLDEMAANHYQLFGFNVFPFEAIFLDDSRLLGGATTDAVSQSYATAGFHYETGDTNPDHIGQEFAFLSYLCQIESQQLKTGQLTAAQSSSQQQLHFLQHHLLRWWLPFIWAVEQQESPFFPAVASLAHLVLSDHYLALTLAHGSDVPAWSLPPTPDVQSDMQTGLKELSAYFTTPAYAGLFLSRDDIGRLARELNLPRGFGERQLLLNNLMHTAVQYDQFSTFLDGLTHVVHCWQKRLQQILASQPLLTPFAKPWQGCTNQTLLLLSHLHQETEKQA